MATSELATALLNDNSGKTDELITRRAAHLVASEARSMKQKMFALALGVLLFVLCFSAEAQQPKRISRLGYLSAGDPVSRVYRIEAFRQGLKELGYVEGKNIII